MSVNRLADYLEHMRQAGSHTSEQDRNDSGARD